MTNETEAREYFIMKRGYYYRPDECGYTDRPILAGLYTEAEAKATTHPNGEDGPRDGMHYFHKSKCKDADYVAYNAQAARIAELKRSGQEYIDVLKARAEAAEANLEKAVRLMELSVELAHWNTTLLDDVIFFITELKESEA